jgi:hypothetical protein
MRAINQGDGTGLHKALASFMTQVNKNRLGSRPHRKGTVTGATNQGEDAGLHRLADFVLTYVMKTAQGVGRVNPQANNGTRYRAQ